MKKVVLMLHIAATMMRLAEEIHFQTKQKG